MTSTTRNHPLLPAPAEFRFLDLPADIRLMVYEYLPTCLTHNQIIIQTHDSSESRDTKVKLVAIWYPTTIRLVCKLIRKEATSIIARTKAKRDSSPRSVAATNLSRLSPKIIVPLGDLEVIAHKGGPLQAALECLAWSLEARKTGSSCVTAGPECSSSGPDSLMIANWARQAGWRLARMQPGTRTIDIAFDVVPVLSGRRSQDAPSLLRFEKDVEKLFRAQPSNARFRAWLTPLGFAGIAERQYNSSRRFIASSAKSDHLVQHNDLEWEEWVKTWVSQDWM
jgi:hypothetical protein